MNTGTLIIFSGLPGSGKSTLASRLAAKLHATYLRIDTIEQGLREVCQIEQIEGRGYRLSYRIAQENLTLGNTVIADSVNPWRLTRQEWNKVAQDIGAPFINIEVCCTDQVEHKRRVENRLQEHTDFKYPHWQEVLTRDYQSWSEERLQLETSGKTIDEAFEELVKMLNL